MDAIRNFFSCGTPKAVDIEAGETPQEASIFSFIPTIEGKNLCEKIWSVVKMIIIAAAAAALFVYCPYVFVAVFFAGIVFDEWMKDGIDKVLAVVKKYWPVAIVVGSVAAFLSLPVSLIILCALVAGYVGSAASRNTNLHKLKENLAKSPKPARAAAEV